MAKAYLSGPNEFGTANDYCRYCEAERQAPLLSQNASATEAWQSQLCRMALAEARAILAETEPRAESWWGNVTPHGRWIDGLGPYPTRRDPYFAALAESLAAFETMTVEQLAKLQQG